MKKKASTPVLKSNERFRQHGKSHDGITKPIIGQQSSQVRADIRNWGQFWNLNPNKIGAQRRQVLPNLRYMDQVDERLGISPSV